MKLFDKVEAARRTLKRQIRLQPEVGLVLGSGLGALAREVRSARRIPFKKVPYMAASRVAGHQGEFLFGELSHKPLMAMLGRLHFYEGHVMETVTFPIRLMKAMGVKILVLISAVGAISKNLKPGNLAVLTDHINLMGENPLMGLAGNHNLSPFVDMSRAYDGKMNALARSIGRACGLSLQPVVYAALRGPSYETPAEIKMLTRLGADVVGMSMAPEVIVARQLNLKVLGLAFISNMAAGIVAGKKLSHEEVLETGRLAQKRLIPFLSALVKAL